MKDIRKSIEDFFENIKAKMKIGRKHKKHGSMTMDAANGDPHANYTPQDRLRGLPYEATVSGKPPRTEDSPQQQLSPPMQEQSTLNKRAPERIPTDLTAVAQGLDRKLQ